MENINPRKELIILMRGMFACRIISALGTLELYDIFLKDSFNLQSFEKVSDKNLLKIILNYLTKLGLIKKINNNKFQSTKLGKSVFKRYGSFLLLDSYKNFLIDLEERLLNNGLNKPVCNRLENVTGSGQTNGRKFFPQAINFISKKKYDTYIDIACGDGHFLNEILNLSPNSNIYALDISRIAVDETLKNLQKKNPNNKKIYKIESNGKDIDYWKSKIDKKNIENKNILISMWYFLHEISENKKENIANFLIQIHKKFPKSDILIGEILCIDDEILIENRHTSILPEYILFHEMSGQGILSNNDFNFIFSIIPYKVVSRSDFDLISFKNETHPSAFVAYLQPK